MQTKILEVRDEGTMFGVIAINMNPDKSRENPEDTASQRYYLRRCGYPCDGKPNIAITHLSADGGRFWNDPFGWKDRTYAVAHKYIIEHWDELADGDVVDVSFILGESATKKISERIAPSPNDVLTADETRGRRSDT